ncbi:B-4DMT family transporter [Mycobacterium sp. MYCO198283]|uniref:B-4DMT family transporter n=1 Tax=Mycobacterium sp. MYCO198283 TaxID=2883505 RepID=UPI001E289C88|nr:B-4DMT family transporter [Mycobacterium sp. MYCO198283]MCG5433630.1 B-4DMT family transporter [Mycobacterium sp. MYCO198283]
MKSWLMRGLVFAAAMVILRLVQSALINMFETKALMISVSLVVIFGVVVAVWGYVDGRADARANPDPDRRDDLAMTWLLAGLVAGILSGLIAWLISKFYTELYAEGLLNEISTFAAFTALLVFLPAILGVAVGRWLVDRSRPDEPSVRRGGKPRDDSGDNTDTDVFAAVRDDDSATQPAATSSSGESAK